MTTCVIEETTLLAKRAHAKIAGASHYLTGKPCKHGHVAARSTDNGSCTACHKEERRRQCRDNPAAEKRCKLKYRSTLRGKATVKAYDVFWRKSNPELVREINRRAQRAFKARHPERLLEMSRAWKRAHPEHRVASENRRRARKIEAGGSHTVADMNRIRILQRNRCAYCNNSLGRKGHLDHIISLCKGGSNWPRNLQWLCASCNTRKQAKDPMEFARAGMLL